MKYIVLVVFGLTLFLNNILAQEKDRPIKRVLFIGNSYTHVNVMPNIFHEIAKSDNEIAIAEFSAPDGYSLQKHINNEFTLSKLKEANWDYIIIQEQSQAPSFNDDYVQMEVYPYAKKIHDLALESNPCAQTIFYQTWGRKNGDSTMCKSWQYVCTYKGMDSLLSLRYSKMAEMNESWLSPVGKVWYYIREKHPEINLYHRDGSHPSKEGSYASALCFYTIIFQKNPMHIKYNYDLKTGEADKIKSIVKQYVYDSLSLYNIYKFQPIAEFNYEINGHEVLFNNNSKYSKNYEWDFGDGTKSFDFNSEHKYNRAGDYEVRLIASKCDKIDTAIHKVSIKSNDSYMAKLNTYMIEIKKNKDKKLIEIALNPKFQIGNKILLTDENGKTLIEHVIDKQQSSLSLDIAKIKQGTYYVHVIVADKSSIKKKIVI